MKAKTFRAGNCLPVSSVIRVLPFSSYRENVISWWFPCQDWTFSENGIFMFRFCCCCFFFFIWKSTNVISNAKLFQCVLSLTQFEESRQRAGYLSRDTYSVLWQSGSICRAANWSYLKSIIFRDFCILRKYENCSFWHQLPFSVRPKVDVISAELNLIFCYVFLLCTMVLSFLWLKSRMEITVYVSTRTSFVTFFKCQIICPLTINLYFGKFLWPVILYKVWQVSKLNFKSKTKIDDILDYNTLESVSKTYVICKQLRLEPSEVVVFVLFVFFHQRQILFLGFIAERLKILLLVQQQACWTPGRSSVSKLAGISSEIFCPGCPTRYLGKQSRTRTRRLIRVITII